LELERLLYTYANKLVDKEIGEDIFVKFLDCIIKTKLNISSLRHISTIIDLLEMENYIMAKSIMCTIIEMENLFIVMTCNLEKIQKSKSMIGKLSRSILSSDGLIEKDQRMIQIRNLYHNMNIYIKSFDFIQNINAINNQTLTINNKEEIINRISLLIKYFGLNFMIMSSVNIITIDDFKYFDLNDAHTYYQDVLDKIKNHVSCYINICDKYIGLYKIYNRINKKKMVNKKGIFVDNNVDHKIKNLE